MPLVLLLWIRSYLTASLSGPRRSQNNDAKLIRRLGNFRILQIAASELIHAKGIFIVKNGKLVEKGQSRCNDAPPPSARQPLPPAHLPSL